MEGHIKMTVLFLIYSLWDRGSEENRK